MWSGCLKWFWSETDDNLCSERRGPSPFPSHCCMNVTCINMSQRGYKKAGPQLCREASHNKFLHRQELCGVAWYSTDIYIYIHYIYVCMCQHMIKYIIYIYDIYLNVTWYINRTHHTFPIILCRQYLNGSTATDHMGSALSWVAKGDGREPMGAGFRWSMVKWPAWNVD